MKVEWLKGASDWRYHKRGDGMKTVVVCAAIIKKDAKVLIAQRKPGGEQGLLWEFPGGKIIPGETPESCLEREIKEELNLVIEVMDIYKVVSHCYTEDRQILLLAYLCKHVAGEGQPLDCLGFRWVFPQELKDYPIAEADLPIVERLLNESE